MLPEWLRHPREATLDPADTLGLVLAWWGFWVLDLQAWQSWLGGGLPSWAWVALAVGYGVIAIAGWPRVIGGPALLCGLSGACVQTLAVNHLQLQDGPGVAVAATTAAACLLVMAFGQSIAEARAMAQRDAWLLALCFGQACAVLTVVVAWAIGSVCC